MIQVGLLTAAVLLLLCSGSVLSPVVSQTCTKLDVELGFEGLDLSLLPGNATVYVCEPRSVETPGVLFIQGFAEPEEVELLRKVAFDQFPKDANGNSYPGDKGYGMRFMVRQEDGQFPVQSDREQMLLQRVNRRMDGVTGNVWNHPYYQFILQNSSDKTGTRGAHMRVHHERNLEEVKRTPDRYSPRIATVLTYLDNAKRGGHTIFPTLWQTSDPRVASLRRRIAGLLNQTHKAISRAEEQAGRLVVDVLNDHGMALNDDDAGGILGELCQEVLDAEEAGRVPPVFAVKGSPGDAMVFWHWTRALVSAWLDRFHGGCPAYDGNKLAMQSYRQGSEYGWLKIVNHRPEELLVERGGTQIATLPAAPERPQFEVLLAENEGVRVRTADGSFSKELPKVRASTAKLAELLPVGGHSQVAPGMKFRIPSAPASVDTARKPFAHIEL